MANFWSTLDSYYSYKLLKHVLVLRIKAVARTLIGGCINSYIWVLPYYNFFWNRIYFTQRVLKEGGGGEEIPPTSKC